MIRIEPINQTWNPGITLIHDKHELRSFHDYMAHTYVLEVQDIVKNMRYQHKFSPLNPKYLDYKIDNNLHLGHWIATGDLINNLKVKSHSTVGFDNRKRHYSNLKYLDLARYLEYGTLRIPPRPLFRLVYERMRRDSSRWYHEWKGDTY